MGTETMCPQCGGAMEAAAENAAAPRICPQCRTAFIAIVFPAALAHEFQGQYGQDVQEESEAVCFHHIDKRAETACDACGRFLCALCAVDVGAKHYCPSCLEHGIRTGALPEFQASYIRYDLLAVAVACIPLMLAVPFLLLVLPWATEIALGFSLAFLIFPSFVTAPASMYLVLRFRKETVHPVRNFTGWAALTFFLAVVQMAGWGVAMIVFMGNILTEFPKV